MTRSSRTAFLLVVVLAATGLPGGAQDLFEVRGRVADETGGSIPGASVTLTDERGGLHASASTDQEGRYQLVAPRPGRATLTVRMAGFAPATRTISVTGNGSATVDVTLRVAITERVDVRSGLARISLDSDQNLSGIRLSDRVLAGLPDDPESLLYALRMLAATTGTRVDQVAVYVDGMPLTNRLPPKDVIQSVRINANPFSAEFAEPGSSRVEILTKPAAQHYHGSGHVDFNDALMNARNIFEPARPRYQSRTYEGHIGGPILRERWGFLLYGGRWEQDDNMVVNATPIDPATLQPQALRLNIAAPTRTSSYSLRSDVRLTQNHTLAVDYGHNEQRRRGAGLQSGFDLPERAYTGDSSEQTTSLWVTSVFPAALNEFRARRSRNRVLDRAVTTTPAIVVLEAFNAGGNQEMLFREHDTDRTRLANVFTFTTPAHGVRIGAQADIVRLRQIDRSNFNGTFIFGSDVLRDAFGTPIAAAGGESTVISGLERYRLTLAGVPGYGPSQFSIVGGDPAIDFRVNETAWFAQDDWRVAPRLTMSYGVRVEHQQRLAQPMQFAPRASVAWAPSSNGDSVVRGGVGLFYTQIPHPLFSDALRLDGRHGQRLVIDRPTFFPTVPEALPGAQNLVAVIRTQAADLTLPSTLASTLSYDRRLIGSVFGSIGYTWRRGSHLLRTRKVDDSAGVAPPPGALILQFESTGRSSSHDINATVSGNVGPYVTVFGGYGWTRAFQDTDDLYTVPADSFNLAADWGLAPVPRNRVSFGGSISLPDDFALYSFVTATSELPFNITSGYDTNRDSIFTDRPAFADVGHPGVVVTPFGTFNPTPGPGEAVIPRNSGIGPTQLSVDLTAMKTFMPYNGPIPSSPRTTISLTVTNLLNRTNYAPFNGVLTSPFFGTANRSLYRRRFLLSARFDF
jgi:hypothetical protein